MAAGRPKKPTAQKKAQGTSRKHRENKNEPKFEPLSVKTSPPDYFNIYAVEMWNTLLKEYEKQKIIETVDVFAFEKLCFNFGIWKDCAVNISRNPLLLENTPHGGTSATVQLLYKSFNACEKMMSRFGLTPSDRSRLGLLKNKDDDPDTNKMKGLIGA